jgi:cysteinyl-tRNA synthetase
MVDTEKMSKSLGNFKTIRQTVGVDAGTDSAQYQPNPREAEMLRFFIVRNHYRSIQNYAPDNLADAQSALDRLYQTLQAVPPEQATMGQDIDWSHGPAADFKQAMDDDFNTAGAVAVLFELASRANRDQDAQASGLMLALGNVLGLLQQVPSEYFKAATRYTKRALQAAAKAHEQANEQENQSAEEASALGTTLSDEAIDQLVSERQAAKLARDFATADRIRDQLTSQGVLLDDKAGGVTQWRRG